MDQQDEEWEVRDFDVLEFDLLSRASGKDLKWQNLLCGAIICDSLAIDDERGHSLHIYQSH